MHTSGMDARSHLLYSCLLCKPCKQFRIDKLAADANKLQHQDPSLQVHRCLKAAEIHLHRSVDLYTITE